MIQQTLIKYVYRQPMIMLLACYVEDSICNASATITIGEPGQEYSPEIENWNAGSSAKVSREF